MRVVLERTGGVAGARRALRLASGSLPATVEGRLRDALARAGFFALPRRLAPAQPRPDAFHYRLEVEDGARRHAVEFEESAAGEDLLRLVEEVEAAAGAASP
jgi:hypothetical protein